jgi:hypothetical protein
MIIVIQQNANFYDNVGSIVVSPFILGGVCDVLGDGLLLMISFFFSLLSLLPSKLAQAIKIS